MSMGKKGNKMANMFGGLGATLTKTVKEKNDQYDTLSHIEMRITEALRKERLHLNTKEEI